MEAPAHEQTGVVLAYNQERERDASQIPGCNSFNGERHSTIPIGSLRSKYDGFRALAYVQDGKCSLVSRNQHRSFQNLRDEFGACLKAHNAILDDEIVCLSEDGRSQFYELLYRRGEPYFYAFDLLWLDGEDLRALLLHGRKKRLRALLPRSKSSRVLFTGHIEETGCAVFREACRMDLEEIAAKLKTASYLSDARSTTWIKIRTRATRKQRSA